MSVMEVPQAYPVHVDQWGVSIQVLVYRGRKYFVFNELAKVLGVAKPLSQVEQLQSHDTLAVEMEKLPVQTRGGRQTSWCITWRGVAGWIFMVNANRVRPEMRPYLRKRQSEMLDVMERVMWGEVTSHDESRGAALMRMIMDMHFDIGSLQRFALFLEEQLGVVQDKLALQEAMARTDPDE